MQSVISYLILLVAGMAMQAQSNTIEVTLTKLKSDKGTIQVGLYNEAGQFLNSTFMSESSEIEDNQAKVTFEDVPDGLYAISTFHDLDDNGELNMMMGLIPSEPYACSMGAKGFFGPPKWKDAVFEIADGEVKEMEIRY